MRNRLAKLGRPCRLGKIGGATAGISSLIGLFPQVKKMHGFTGNSPRVGIFAGQAGFSDYPGGTRALGFGLPLLSAALRLSSKMNWTENSSR